MQLRKILVVSVVMTLLFGVTANAGDENCYGYTSTGNPFVCGAYGNCVWWAAYKRSDLRVTMTGSAVSWYEDARRLGFSIEQSPSIGSIVVFDKTSNNIYGHVAHVEMVYGDGSFSVSEMDYYGTFGDGVQYATYRSVTGGYKRESGVSTWKVLGFISKEGRCNTSNWRCAIRSPKTSTVGWFPPVDDCQQASQWYNMATVNGEKTAVGSTTKSACPLACYAN